MMTPDEAALMAAYDIEDIFCQSFVGGRVQRLARIQSAVNDAITRCSPQTIATLRDHRLARIASEPSPIPQSDSAPPPRAVPAGPPAVSGCTALPLEDKPIPQPAPFPTVQSEAVGKQGEDQRAQNEVGAATTTSAGAAQAGHQDADPRNSSRSAGAGPVLIPAVRTKPAIKSKPIDPTPGRTVGVVITAKGSVVDVDIINFVVRCPDGDWQVSRPVVLIMERMRNGETFDLLTLADLGGMGLENLKMTIPRWTVELAKRGVDFVSMKGVGCKIRRAGT